MKLIKKYIVFVVTAFIITACQSIQDATSTQQTDASSTVTKEQKLENPVKIDTPNHKDNTTIELTKIQKALLLGDVGTVSQTDLIDATLTEIDRLESYLQDAKNKIFNLNTNGTPKKDGSSLTSIDWNPTHDASLLRTTIGINIPLLDTNSVEINGYTIYHKTISAIGKKNNGKYIVFGSNPFRTAGNIQMQKMLENSLSWLSGKDDLKDKPFSVVLAHLDNSYYFKDESKTRDWLDQHYGNNVNYNSPNSCDGEKLQICLDKKPNLIIVSQFSTDDDNLSQISNTLNQALENNISIIYIHHDGDLKPLGKELFNKVFDIEYIWDNYWHRLKLDKFDPTTLKTSEELKMIKKLYQHLYARDYFIDWSKCENGNCNKADDLKKEFLDGAKSIKSMLNNLDNSKKRIFDKNNRYTFQKLLVLTGDKLRQTVHFPMDKESTDDNDFLRSLLADYSVFNFRDINPAQTDMGNFSRSDFSHITPFNARVKTKSKKYFKATGIYALPGKSVTIKRYDESNLKVKVFINTLRSAATHEYEKNGYKRPKFLQTPHFDIKPHESITITSPYGGPIQLEFNKNDLNVDIEFKNIAKHPFWSCEEDSEEFAKKLEKADFDWAEIVTDGFEVHSTLKKIKKSLSDKKWENVDAFAKATKRYISNYPHILAGFKGDGIDTIAEINSFAVEHNITIESIDIVKHMNADQATCGYGCSGNPYDAYWAFSPIFHGDLHELGHGLESSRLRFEGFNYHSTTNPYSYYSKSKYFELTGDNPNCQNLPFKELFENIQNSLAYKNPTLYLKENFWNNSNWSHQVLLTIEAMMHVQKMGKLENGWHLLARLHLLDREIKRAKKDWEIKKQYIGFSEYSLDEFNNISKNDWLLISFSFASELDFRDYFNMMGIEYSKKASQQVASFGYEKVPQKLFVSTPNGYCKNDEYGNLLDKTLIDVTQETVFPY